jgi:hypothetical protein
MILFEGMAQPQRRIKQWIVDADSLLAFMKAVRHTKPYFYGDELPDDCRVVGTALTDDGRFCLTLESESFRPLHALCVPTRLNIYVSDKPQDGESA